MRLKASLLVFLGLLHESRQISYENPVKSAFDDQITFLPGLTENINFKQYSGYLAADIETQRPEKLMFYWFVESQSSPANDPVLVWLNGGPGCSSLTGFFTELGPFFVNSDGSTLRRNNFSWNKVANVLFLDSPVGVGFSYNKEFNLIHTDDSTAKANHLALKSFMKKFPQYRNNPLYLSGESYAGVYVSTLSLLVDADPQLNLKGLAIGNGFLHADLLAESLMYFSYYHGIIGKSEWNLISKDCCDGRVPGRGNCNKIGTDNCKKAQSRASKVAGGVNPYNVYGDCHDGRNSALRISEPGMVAIEAVHEPKNKREIFARALRDLAITTNASSNCQNFTMFDPFDQKHSPLRHSDVEQMQSPCIDDTNLINYLNQKDVRKALHVPEKVKRWDACSRLGYIIQYSKRSKGLAPQLKSLIGSKRHLTILIYNGNLDAMCNFLGNEWFVDDLGLRMISDHSEWKVNKQVAGFVKRYKGLTLVNVRGAGHMVPEDKPREALEMIKTFLLPENQPRNELL